MSLWIHTSMKGRYQGSHSSRAKSATISREPRWAAAERCPMEATRGIRDEPRRGANRVTTIASDAIEDCFRPAILRARQLKHRAVRGILATTCGRAVKVAGSIKDQSTFWAEPIVAPEREAVNDALTPSRSSGAQLKHSAAAIPGIA